MIDTNFNIKTTFESKFYPGYMMTLSEKKFWRFHQANPDVFEQLQIQSRELIKHGRNRWSINAFSEVYRWSLRETIRFDEFKMSNDTRPFYARLAIENAPDIAHLFTTHTQWAGKGEKINESL